MRRVLILPLLLLALAGCALGDDDASIERGELKHVVLQPGDLPRVFIRFDEGRQVLVDLPRGSRADGSRFGRIEGWKARYRRPGTPRTAGPLVVESRADLFESSEGAEDDVEAARKELGADGLGWKPIDEPGIGDESFAATFVEGAVRYYLVFWRDANATATLNVNGFEGELPLAEALALARTQQERIARAADS